MPIKGRYFPGQRSEEKIFLLLRRHWITYGIFLGLFFLMAIPLIIVIVIFMNSTIPISPILINLVDLVIPAYLLVMVGLMLYGFVDYYLDVYIVTNERIIDISQNGFFRREISELHLHQVQDVSATEKGALPTLFHYGDVSIQTAAEQKNFIFRSIPHPYRVSKKIVDLHEAQLEEAQREEGEVGKESGEFSKEFKVEGLNTARKQTKEFFKGHESLDTGIGPEELREESESSKSNKIISGLEKTTKKTKEPVKKIDLSKTKDEEHELHENEEIDL